MTHSEDELVARELPPVTPLQSLWCFSGRDHARCQKDGCECECHAPRTDPIRSAVAAVLTNVSNYPRGAQAHIMGQDLNDLVDRVAAAVRPVSGA